MKNVVHESMVNCVKEICAGAAKKRREDSFTKQIHWRDKSGMVCQEKLRLCTVHTRGVQLDLEI